MTLQLLEEEEGQAWATGTLFDSVGCSTKIHWQARAVWNRLYTNSINLFIWGSDIWTDWASKEASQQKNKTEKTTQNKHQTNKTNYRPQIVSLLRTTVISSSVPVTVLLSWELDQIMTMEPILY